jgi:hypothetical protein
MAAALKFPLRVRRGFVARRGPEAMRAFDDAENADITTLLQRFAYLLGIQRIWATQWQEIADYVLPRKNSIIVQRIAGTKRTQRLFDSTALEARDKLSRAINGALTPSTMRWFYLMMEDAELNKDQQVAIWCDQVGELILGDLNRSNFASEWGEVCTDFVTFANALMFMEEAAAPGPHQFGGFQFRTEAIGRYAWSEGKDGRVNTLFRELTMSAQAIKDKWKSTPDEIIDKEARTPEAERAVIHCAVPNEDGSPGWRSVYLLQQSRYKLDEGKYDDFPFLGIRPTVASGETYGRWITDDAMPDIRSLNKAKEFSLRTLPMIMQPPLSSNGDVVGPARLVPLGITTVRGGTSRSEAVGPLLPPGTLDLRQANLEMQDLRASIKGMYHDAELQLPNGPQMTAEEVRARRDQMLMILGPVVYGRIEREGLHPLIDFCFEKRRKARALPPLPSALQMALGRGNVRLAVRYDGPIARAQRASDVTAISQLYDFAQKIATVEATAAPVIDTIDNDQAMRVAGRKLGVDPSIIRDEKGTDQVRQVKAQQQAQEQQAAQQAQAAESAGKAAPMVKAAGHAPEPNSPLANLANQGGGQNAAGA